jgi:hypothetical protein
MAIDFPCKCGHSKKEHRLSNKGNLGCMVLNYFTDNYDGCWKYIPDNLKYLEQRYEALHG